MGFVIGLLTFVMLVDCLVLVLLVLVQLPKKEAGAGLAFGGAATDALFGAGSGNVLTKITKYAAITFFVLAMGLSLLQTNYHRRSTNSFQQKLMESGSAPMTAAPAPTAPTAKSTAPLTSTNVPLLSPPVESTNTPSGAAPSSAPATGSPQK